MDPQTPFKATLLASLAAAWAPAGSAAQPLELAQSPPAAVPSQVAPNVIVSLDDSGSMRWRLTTRASDPRPLNGRDYAGPDRNGTWPADTNRVSVLRHALSTVFSDRQLLADGSIRLAWQVMNNGPRSLHGNVSNAMRELNPAHRERFLDFVRGFTAGQGTPTHSLMQRADTYMRAPLDSYSPWAAVPGTRGEPYLGCRRNYHILMTNGGWNQQIATHQIPFSRNFDGTSRRLPDGRWYETRDPQTRIYRDDDTGAANTAFSTIADWALKSWADPFHDNDRRLQGRPQPSADYLNAPATETFTNRRTQASVTLDKYWNPRHNPATWPHMVTFTIGFSNEALPSHNYDSRGRYQGELQAPSSTVPYGYDGDFADYALGRFAWRAAGMVTRENALPSTVSADRGHDMWHAAINGRGRFYAVNRSEDLVTAFRQIVQQISVESKPGRGSAATSGSSITRSAVGLYAAHYDPRQAWKGWITGQTVATAADGSVATTATSGWQGKSTADRLDELSDAQTLDSRTVLAWNDDTGRGVAFQWQAIGRTQQARLNRTLQGGADGQGPDRLQYLRGVRRMEGTATPPSDPDSRPFRQRHSRQGDIINSAIWYTGTPSGLQPTAAYREFAQAFRQRTPMLYVGGNDGMLHGFSAEDGSEKLAYVPRGVMPGLAELTEPGYDDRHRYFADGSPMTGDVQDGSQWKTLLVGTLGAGGKGYFVLDATDPQRFAEARASSLVLMDRSMHASETRPADCAQGADAAARDACEADKDLGHIFAAPVPDDADPQRSIQITRLNNGRWAVVMGNGYNSQAGRAVLLLQYLDGQRELLRLRAPAATAAGASADNGLSAPRLVDINGDGRPDVVYAGDLQGHLWKFIIASEDPAQWGVAFGGQPLFSAVPGGAESAITAAPTVRANDRQRSVRNAAGQPGNVAVGGMMVAFGTGRNVTPRDPRNPAPGTVYAVLDNTRYKQVPGSRVAPCLSLSDSDCRLSADQVPRPVRHEQLVVLTEDSSSATADQGASGGSGGSRFSRVDGGGVDWNTHRGWRFRLPQSGERLLKPMAFYDDSNLLAIFSQIPARAHAETSTGDAQETCDATVIDGERQFLTLLNIMDGKRPSVPIMDANGDGLYSAADQGAHRMETAPGAKSLIIQGERIVMKGGDDALDLLTRMPEQPARPSWRQLQ